jgi:signal transduction histidine kinase/ActR/RegA family two-component response regulator/HPt (histidine-containing phosphotransfer) domain-containing protein
MTLDIRTLVLVGAITMAVSTVVFFSLYRFRFGDKSPLAWCISSAAITVGCLLLALRDAIPPVFTILVANMFFVFGYAMIYSGVRLFMGRSPRWILAAAAPLVLVPILAWFVFIDPSLAVRSLVIRLFLSLIPALIWRELAAGETWRYGRPQRVVAGLYAAETVLNLLFALAAPLAYDTDNFFTSGVLSALFLLLCNIYMLVHVLGVVVLYGERYRSELAAAKEAAEEASRAKSRFLAHMSHELRTPLNGLIGMLDLSRDTPSDAQRSEFLDLAAVSAQNLLTLINDILDLSRLEAGKLTVSPEPFALAPVLDAVLTPFARMAQAQGLGFAVDVDPADVRIAADAGRLRQIVLNLIGNALKFTQKGRIDVEIRVRPGQPGPGRLTLCVADTGCGIPADMQERVFENFSQTDEGARRGGTGLGLTISRQLARIMGGELTVSSAPGEGARFTLEMPCQVLDPAEPQAPEPTAEAALAALAAVPRMRVLVVDDFEPNRMVIATRLRMAGHHAAEAADGQEAVNAVAHQAFDLVLMDVGMPGMDGLSATQRIRAMSGRRTPIAALTAAALPGDREQCLAAGMDDYLTKPLHPAELLRVLARFAPDASPSPSDPPPHGPTPVAPVAPVAPAANVATPPGTSADPADIDWRHALEFMGGNTDDLEALCAVVVEVFARERAALREDLAAGDLTALPGRLHRLRPTLQSFGAVALADLALAVEEEAAAGRAQAAAGLAQDLERGLSDFLAQMRRRGRPRGEEAPGAA